jgi:AraC-like DNA-binding protein
MKHRNLNKFSLEYVDKLIPNGIKNFTIFNPETILPHHPADEPYFFNGFVLGICTQGEATIQINFKEHVLKPNHTLMVLPSQVFKIVEQSDDFNLSALLFSLDFFVELVPPSDFEILFHIAKTPYQKVSDELAASLMRYYNYIVKQYLNDKKFFRVQIIRGLLYSLFMEVVSLYKTGQWSDTNSLTRQEKMCLKFFELLVANYQKERNIDFYADNLCITKKYLSTIVKNVSGYSVRRWIDEVIITEAKIKLKTSNLSVLQIAEEVDFANPSFFGQYFKKHTGTTPHRYRNK